MVSVEEAVQIIFQKIKDYGTELIPLHESSGRILQEDLIADRDMPPYDRVTMDGIAMQFQAFQNGTREFTIEGIAAAGDALKRMQSNNACLEVMTGSILPENTDTVIRYEDLLIENGAAKLNVDAVNSQQNVHFKGEDRKEGEVVVKKGKKMSPAEIGIAATFGKAKILVSRLPKTVVISTGDELVEIDQEPLAHQIRKSNVHRIKTTLLNLGIKADTLHLDDDLEEIKSALQQVIETYEVIILSGGVSKGKFDFLPEALDNLGVKKLFHKIRQRPGKPMWFGEAPNGTLVFAMPGNPVSSFLCTQRYFKTWLAASLKSEEESKPKAELAEDILFKPDLTYFAQVKLDYSDEGKLLAYPRHGHGSGDLANLTDADAFIELTRGKDQYKAGEVYTVFKYR